MRQPISTVYPISDILEWDYSKQIRITPKFQRRSVWMPKAKSYLMDTIVRGMPMPPIYIRPLLDTDSHRTIREVVDGQQRIRTILEYIKGEFSILSTHNKDLGGIFYSELSDQVKRNILEYKITANLLESISDSEVLELFSRINTYTVPLNAQELRNAQFFGLYKQSIYTLAHKHYKFFVNNKILTDVRIARMGDAELVSEIMTSFITQTWDTSNKVLRETYERFDDNFSNKDIYQEMFSETINFIAEVFGDGLKDSLFRRTPLFYSLFILCVNEIYSVEKALQGELERKDKGLAIRNITRMVKKVDELSKNDSQNREWLAFESAYSKGTASAKSRILRNTFLSSLSHE
ncbi:DUF262 domain-containing protein [Deinococcus budaensis]|uniref:GmrSD restriction endonucleases N-terminal domain-containing protein n=1 Tax=Deinococcus budaensis TaxID=1665626 RepID=A0A7W8GIH8_9DEIO|nr:DUF262 domain-containing protein [Deinococcus budaensis]MBB5236290.1 hypothetical protein [Deinococcus budaensis]